MATLPPDSDAATDRRLAISHAAAPGAALPPAVEFSHVSLAFDDVVVLRDLSFSVPKGAMRVLLGVSGSGKSVILKLILGLLRPDAGAVLVNGERVDTMTEAELLQASFRSQHINRRIAPDPTTDRAEALLLEYR